jgi:4-hydroxy-tetrahydrodipicolinate synthase
LLLIQAVFRMRLTKEVLRRRGVLKHTGVRAPLPEFDSQDQREIDLCLRDLEDLVATEAGQLTAVGG